MTLQLQQRQADRAAQQAAAAPKADPAPTSTASPAPMQHAAAAAEATTSSGTAGEGAADASAGVARDPAAAASLTQLAVWVVRYCRQLWAAVGGKYGEVEAGQALGHHFSEVCQVRYCENMMNAGAVLLVVVGGCRWRFRGMWRSPRMFQYMCCVQACVVYSMWPGLN